MPCRFVPVCAEHGECATDAGLPHRGQFESNCDALRADAWNVSRCQLACRRRRRSRPLGSSLVATSNLGFGRERRSPIARRPSDAPPPCLGPSPALRRPPGRACALAGRQRPCRSRATTSRPRMRSVCHHCATCLRRRNRRRPSLRSSSRERIPRDSVPPRSALIRRSCRPSKLIAPPESATQFWQIRLLPILPSTGG